MFATKYIKLSTRGHTDIIDITPRVNEILTAEKISGGLVTIQVCGSTAALTTCEYESGLIKDLKEFFERLIPEGKGYHHDAAWHDGNGHSHLRASLVGPSLTLAFQNRKLLLGTWQQVILIDFDNRKRERELVVQILGE